MTQISLHYILCCILLVSAYWFLPRNWRLHYISLVSIIGLATFSITSAIILVSINLTVLLAYKLSSKRPVFLVLGVLVLILCLVLYKSLPYAEGYIEALILIGFTFYTLKAIHVLMEIYKGQLAHIPLPLLFAYLSFFPAILTGPIHRIGDFNTNWQRQSFNKQDLSFAIERLIWGYTKFILVAEKVVNQKGDAFIQSVSTEHVRFIEYFGYLQYGANLYFSFAGATDIAIAFGLMIGFKLNENFNYPFIARNIADFWRRWHMSLSEWCKMYIYQPVVSLTRNHQIAIFATMSGIAIWHELSLRYFLWGLYHSVGLMIHARFKKWLGNKKQPAIVQHAIVRNFLALIYIIITFNFVIIGFGITSHSSLTEIYSSYSKFIFGAN